MGRKTLIGDKVLLNQAALAANAVTAETVCENVDLITYDLIWSNGNTPDFTVNVEWSHDNSTWRTLDFGTTIQISGASGSHKIDIEPNFKFVRINLTRVAGDADVIIIVKGTTKGA